MRLLALAPAVVAGRRLIRARRDNSGARAATRDGRAADMSAGLVYELLDAHDDTARLAAELSHDPRWAAHLNYLQALQRKGREALAHGSPGRADMWIRI